MDLEKARARKGPTDKTILEELKIPAQAQSHVCRSDIQAFKLDFSGWYYQWIFEERGPIIAVWDATIPQPRYRYFRSPLCFFGAFGSIWNCVRIAWLVTALAVRILKMVLAVYIDDSIGLAVSRRVAIVELAILKWLYRRLGWEMDPKKRRPNLVTRGQRRVLPPASNFDFRN